MLRRVAAFALLLGLTATFALGPVHAHSSPTIRAVDLAYYVHGFTDANTMEGDLTTEPPANESAQTGTCTDCVGEDAAVYTFRTTEPFDRDVEVDTEDPARFVFWIRAYQAAPGLGAPPLDTTVTFNLTLDDGTVIGNASKTLSVATFDPVQFEADFKPTVGLLPTGSGLVWTVSIAGANGYNPSAAPYGVDPTHPFMFRVVQLVPIPDMTVQLAATTAVGTPFVAGTNASIEFTVEYTGPSQTNVFVSAEALPNATIDILGTGNASGSFLTLQPSGPVPLTARVVGLSAGSYSLHVTVTGTKGELAGLAFPFTVQAPPPPEPEDDGGGIPAPSLPALLLGLTALAWARRRLSP